MEEYKFLIKGEPEGHYSLGFILNGIEQEPSGGGKPTETSLKAIINAIKIIIQAINKAEGKALDPAACVSVDLDSINKYMPGDPDAIIYQAMLLKHLKGHGSHPINMEPEQPETYELVIDVGIKGRYSLKFKAKTWPEYKIFDDVEATADFYSVSGCALELKRAIEQETGQQLPAKCIVISGDAISKYKGNDPGLDEFIKGGFIKSLDDMPETRGSRINFLKLL